MTEPTVSFDWQRNPFVNHFKLGASGLLKVIFMSLLIAPLRALCMGFLACLAYIVTLAALPSQKASQVPFQGFRRKSRNFIASIFIFAHCIAGFKYTIKGRRGPPWEAPILVLAAHTPFFDALPYCLVGAPSVVAKKCLFNLPFVGSFLKMTFPIIVDREQKDSRKETMRAIKDRAVRALNSKHLPLDDQWPQVAIFPEGTCTNRSQLISFKLGAFCPQLPVQPVCLKWSVPEPDSVTWAYEGPPILRLLWLSLCKLKIRLELEYLPVYVPSEEEIMDPRLYAHNVRETMAKCLNLPTTEYTLDDAPYLSNHSRANLEYFHRLCEQLPKNLRSVKHTLQDVQSDWEDLKSSCFKDKFFLANFEEFSVYVDVKPCEYLRRLFNSFDWQARGKIDMREFLLVRNFSCLEEKEYLNFALKVFCDENRAMLQGDKSILMEEDFIKIVRFPFFLSISMCKRIYKVVTQKRCGLLDSILEALADYDSRHTHLKLTKHQVVVQLDEQEDSKFIT